MEVRRSATGFVESLLTGLLWSALISCIQSAWQDNIRPKITIGKLVSHGVGYVHVTNIKYFGPMDNQTLVSQIQGNYRDYYALTQLTFPPSNSVLPLSSR
ncbi:hypothetical protein M8J76_010956 [Diaphorina citri]|nr:hypothetical protein M8J75_006813 [Diaphorina citri]KAI5745423.1 hypothetical protein M8J76_010956 [Diaphorina citri]